MKYLFLFLPFFANAQITWTEPGSFSAFDSKCVEWRDTTAWKIVNAGDTTHAHKWVYAEYSDLNKTSNFTYAVHCPCGCGGSEEQGRICKTCLRSERRNIKWGYTVDNSPSEYTKLQEKLNPPKVDTLYKDDIEKMEVIGAGRYFIDTTKVRTLSSTVISDTLTISSGNTVTKHKKKFRKPKQK